ncbi:hypothetical protein F6Y05_37935 [Bacillus megaterium]|nr:hypothetical protein [Priestia megaterium]
MFPTRKERHKNASYINWPSTMFLFGVYWCIYFFTPTARKGIWAVLLTGVIATCLTALFDRFKMPVTLKWLLSTVICIIGIIISAYSLNQI